MTLRPLFLVLAFLAIASSSSAQKQSYTYEGSATELARFALIWEQARAKGNLAPNEEAVFIGYFQGYVNGVFFSHSWPCAGQGIPMEQVWAVVAKYLRDNPERWGLRADDLVLEAATRVWGCKAK